MSDAGLYIHVPFCTSVCPYCDFAVTIAGGERRDQFVAGIAAEAALRSELGLRFDTLYLGGGTPSCLDSHQLEELLVSLRGSLDIDDDAGLYLEINPEDVTRESVQRWRDLGFGTVSLGIQAFDDDTLAHLGRRHTAGDAGRALDLLCEAEFGTVSVDLIYGIDGQNPEQWRRQLREAVDRHVDHLSCYQLTFHGATKFGRRLVSGRSFEMPENEQAELFLLTHLMLGDLGFEGYEVSNFASSPKHRSIHNQKYWTHTPYLGLGPSAHSFVGRRRWWNLRKVRLWGREAIGGRLPEGGAEDLTKEDLALETVMLGVRTMEGIDVEQFASDFGVDLIECNRDTLDRFFDAGLLVLEGAKLRPTLSGMAVADTLARSLEMSTT